jgi:UDP-N-acetylglucosamine--N-acetylmuramyl-(pentapeptide) pyrophosphoryl-undecaprenol N-acetylglucosamine transferase
MPQPEFTAEALADRLETLLAQPADLALAAAVGRGWCVIDAAQRLAEAVLDVIHYPGSGTGGCGHPVPDSTVSTESRAI